MYGIAVLYGQKDPRVSTVAGILPHDDVADQLGDINITCLVIMWK